jgi:hypothetical protein
MKWLLAAVLTVASFAPLTAVQAQSVRHGVVLGLQPIDNRGDDESQTHKMGRHWGSTLGNLVGIKAAGATDNGYVAQAVGNTAPAVGEAVGGNIAGQGPSAHYMVKVQLDDGKVMALVQTGQAVQGLGVGSKVAVSGSGADARLSAE